MNFKSFKPATYWSALGLGMALMLSSCGGKAPEHAKYVPADANAVMSIDIAKINEKVPDLDQIIIGMGAPEEEVNKIFASGVDMAAAAYLFGTIPNGQTRDGKGGFVFLLSDAAKFEATMVEAKMEVNESDGIKIAQPPHNKNDMAIGWKENLAIVRFTDSDEDIVELLKSNFSLSDDQALISTDDKFKDAMGEKGDLNFWVNVSSFNDMAMQEMGPASDFIDFNDTYATGTLAFNDGEMVLETKSFYGEKLQKYVNSVLGSGVSSSVTDALPGDDCMGVYGYSLNMDGIKEVLKESGALNDVPPMVPVDNILDAFSGDIAISINGVTMIEKEQYDYVLDDYVKVEEPQPQGALVLGINDEAKLDALIGMGAMFGLAEIETGVWNAMDKGYLIKRDGALIATFKDDLGEKIKSGDAASLDGEYASVLNESIAGIKFNVKSIPASMLEEADVPKEIIGMIPVEDFTLTSTKSGDVIEGKVVVKTTSADENSLKTLITTVSMLAPMM